MTLDKFVESKGCTLELLRVNRETDPRYEVMAPDHKCFDIGLHSLICFDSSDVRERLGPRGYQLEDCPADCDCRS